MNYSPDEIIITIGATQALDIAFRTILDEGAEVIIPAPAYPGYEPLIRLAGGKPIYADTRKTNFKINAKLIEQLLTDRTRCILLPYPSNPTGGILEEEELKEIMTLLKDKEIFILSDEIYSELVYGRSHHSIATYENMRNRTIMINGLSKSHSMTGWRIGFTCAPSYITQHMLKVHQYNVTCASTISQYAALEALTNGINDAEEMRNAYTERRDYVYHRLITMGMEATKPEGAFYIFPSIQKFQMSSFDFSVNLLEKEQVAVVPGSSFTNYGEGYIRISYAYSMDLLKEGCDRIERFINNI